MDIFFSKSLDIVNEEWRKGTTLTLGDSTQPAVTCSNLTIEILEQDVKYVQS